MTASHHRPERIAVGIDGSVASHAALRWAVDHARPDDTVTLIHAWQPSPITIEAKSADRDDDSAAHRLVNHELARIEALPRDPGVALVGAVVHGDPRDCLGDIAGEADLVVIGAGGHGSVLGALLGSVSAHLAHHVQVPLVIIPASPGDRPPKE